MKRIFRRTGAAAVVAIAAAALLAGCSSGPSVTVKPGVNFSYDSKACVSSRIDAVLPSGKTVNLVKCSGGSTVTTLPTIVYHVGQRITVTTKGKPGTGTLKSETPGVVQVKGSSLVAKHPGTAVITGSGGKYCTFASVTMGMGDRPCSLVEFTVTK